jgi:hypothetical protein
MVAPQPPPLPVFFPAQAVAGADVPSQSLAPVAAIETSHMVAVDGPSHRHSGGENLVRFGRLSKLTDRPMNGGNQIGKLIGLQPMVPDIALDDFRR